MQLNKTVGETILNIHYILPPAPKAIQQFPKTDLSFGQFEMFNLWEEKAGVISYYGEIHLHHELNDLPGNNFFQWVPTEVKCL